MIFNYKKLPTATLSGLEFHYQSSSLTAGRKTITHEYPNADFRYVEDLGKQQKTFTFRAYIDNSANYNLRDSFVKMLSTAGIKPFQHPEFEEIDVVVKTYSINNGLDKLGYTEIELTLEEAELNKYPTRVAGNKGFLQSLKSKILGNNEVRFNNAWKNIKDFKAGLDKMNSTIKKAGIKLERASATIGAQADTLSDFSASINQLVTGGIALARTPSVLATKIKGAFENLELAYTRAEDLFGVSIEIASFDASDGTKANSNRNRDIVNNQNAIQDNIRANALALAYSSAGAIEYTSLEDLNQVVSKLEASWRLYGSTLNREAKAELNEQRNNITILFANLSLNLPKIIDLEVQKENINNLCYQLYGNLDFVDILKGLNNFVDVSNINGTIKVLNYE